MCRFLAYRGESVYLDEYVCAPSHSLLRQSLRAEEAKVATNGDGFGIGWYSERGSPGVYREVTPAWSDENLQSLSRHVRSALFFAHVRAATGTPIARANCHPFVHGQWLFMHNGQLAGYAKVKRGLETLLPDALYAQRHGATDSELLFLLILAQIERGASVLDAVSHVLAQALVAMRQAQVNGPLRFAAALSDGRTLYGFRAASDGRPPSLYMRTTESGLVLASEPVDADTGTWQAVADGHALVCDSADVRSVPLPAFMPLPQAA
jgi:predicted glutamine amidotransferase